MKTFKEYLGEHNHYADLRRQIEQQAGAPRFSQEAAEVWSDFVRTMSDEEFIDMVRWQNETGNTIVPDEFLPRIRRFQKEIESAIAVANSSARSPAQRAKIIDKLVRKLGRKRGGRGGLFGLALAGLLGLAASNTAQATTGSPSTTPLNP
tara:strand:- start:64 stop:513 length:450 start_codon:yes stop_codon:yes gene_type:complete